jgi:hypothetical protein
VSVTGDPRRDTTGDGACRAEEGLRRRLVSLLTEQDIHQVPIPVNGAVEVDQAPFHFEERLVYQLGPIRPRRCLRKVSLSRGASCASHSRTASCVKTMPRSRNISGRSRRLNL